MPSNAMKISHVIQAFQGLRGFHGDLDVVMAVDGRLIALDERNINVAGEVGEQPLAQPVLVLGLSRDDAGRMKNNPGAVYVATADAGDWNYNRSAAPEGEDVRVWKRHGGQDIGRREGDKWFVREGAAEWPPRPVEIIPAGILGWKPLDA